MRRLLLATLIASTTVLATDKDTSPKVEARFDGPTLIVDVDYLVPVNVDGAWAVLTDFEHMHEFMPNLESSKILSRRDNHLRIEQTGTARYGILAFPFRSVRDIELAPKSLIISKMIEGDVKSLDSESRIDAESAATAHIRYHARIVPDRWIPDFLTATVIRGEIGKQFEAMGREMKRRQAHG
ncbi:SRPBCC family protein [Parachitinimonas caeni]|uniref:SRPBCC family protein n=1 Tax=Parachitinimonas caeni TaxID=3031301 RepID=A0ABT7DWA2_9NEIS|nr:SRPBCC family protein [Parachitinimonas caeni]MDK2124316.1 SRPBCC family protein [Parachitinimonas caeni]